MTKWICLCVLFVSVAQGSPGLSWSHEAPQGLGWSISPPEGFAWYNLPQTPKKPKKQEKTVRVSSLPIDQQLKVVRHYLNDAKAKAVLYPNPVNAYHYILWEYFVKHQSLLFSQAMQQAYYHHPELNYRVTHPAVSVAQPLLRKIHKERVAQAIRQLSSQFGLFFFYRGSDPLDARYAAILKDFSERNQLVIIPITTDGIPVSAYPHSHFLTGGFKKIVPKVLPAIMLVNPKQKIIKPLGFGMMTEDQLSDQFFRVATHFKEDT